MCTLQNFTRWCVALKEKKVNTLVVTKIRTCTLDLGTYNNEKNVHASKTFKIKTFSRKSMNLLPDFEERVGGIGVFQCTIRQVLGKEQSLVGTEVSF